MRNKTEENIPDATQLIIPVNTQALQKKVEILELYLEITTTHIDKMLKREEIYAKKLLLLTYDYKDLKKKLDKLAK